MELRACFVASIYSFVWYGEVEEGMILSHRYRFIFIKTTKTAGTSLEIALSKFCGPEDVITPITPEDENVRRALGYPGPQNYDKVPFGEYRLVDWLRLLLKGERKLRFYNHMPAREIRALVPSEVWNTYYKFCFERNPWDRVVSVYYRRTRKGPRPPFDEFITSGALEYLKRTGYGLYTIEHQVVVDRVYLYEQLEDALQDIRERLGLPEPLKLPRVKSGYRDRRSYRDLYSPWSRDLVARVFREEIEMFGYVF